jgi:ribosomal protein S18 acetylase RimI-like enzyme
MIDIGLRPVLPADREFCFQVHRAAMREYVEAVRGWHEPDARDYYLRKLDSGHWQIITADGADVGVLKVDQRSHETYLGLIELHPAHQGRGIGTHLIARLQEQAAGKGQDLLLDVLVVNHRAHALYRRLGFREVVRYEDDTKIRMRWTADRAE